MEQSLETRFEVGMQLEIPNPDTKDTYWRASIKMICGPLLALSYIGIDDISCDIWRDVKSNENHFAGWCKTNSKKLFPPKGIFFSV